MASAALALVLGAGSAFAASLDEARALYREGKIAEAAEAFRAAAVELEARDPFTAAGARNNACVLWRSSGDLDRAEEDCRHALRLRSGDDAGEGQAKTYNNLGLVLQRRADYDGAREAFERALAINRTLGLAANEAINLSNLGVNAIQAGWYAVAIDLFESIDDLTARFDREPWAARQRELARINLAVVHERLGAYREALRLYDEALDQGESLPPGQRATLSVNRAVAYRNLGDPVRAERAFENAEATYREIGDRPALLNVLLNRALVQHLNLNRHELAELLYREALSLAEELGEATQRLQCLDYLGRFLLDRERVDEAEAMFRASHDLARQSGSSEGRAASLEGLGRCELARGDVDAALEHALAGIEEIEQVRGSLASDTLRATYHAGKRLVYALAVEALAREAGGGSDTERALEALRIVHRAKARELVDRLGLDDTIEFGAGRPDVGDGRILVEYFVAGSRLYGWLLTEDAIEMLDLGDAGPILDAAVGVQAGLGRSRSPEPEALDRLSASLLAPFPQSELQAGRWTISTDLGLDRLPFEVLGDPLDGSRPLVERVDLSYLPSGAMLGEGLHRRVGANVVGIGDPVRFDDGGPAGYFARRFDLGALDGAAVELASLPDWLDEPATVLRGDQATEEAFEQAYAAGARVLHVATHTVLDEGPEGSSAILLTPGASSDGLLHPGEIARLGGSSRLTVLAACRTAAGSDVGEPALRGLTGAFLISGSASVVATLWDVGDETTRVFMEQFYHGLDRGLSADAALAAAKRTLIADSAWADPSIWAAYVLIGNPMPVTDRGPLFLVWLLPVLLIVAVVCVRWRYGRTSKRVA